AKDPAQGVNYLAQRAVGAHAIQNCRHQVRRSGGVGAQAIEATRQLGGVPLGAHAVQARQVKLLPAGIELQDVDWPIVGIGVGVDSNHQSLVRLDLALVKVGAFGDL